MALREFITPECACWDSPLPWFCCEFRIFDSLSSGSSVDFALATLDCFWDCSVRVIGCCGEAIGVSFSQIFVVPKELGVLLWEIGRAHV